jgi:hypothetical protein
MDAYCFPLDFEIVPLSEKTCSLCEDGCESSSDDIFCCCWICTPFAFVIDVITCCPRCMCHKCKECKESKKDKKKPVITI